MTGEGQQSDKAYLFFDIGDFASNLGPVYDLADETGSDTSAKKNGWRW